MSVTFNNRLRQILLLAVIILLAILLLNELYAFLPGFLGAITLYILLRNSFFKLTILKKWNSTFVAVSFLFASLFVFAIPIYLSFRLLSAKLITMLSNPTDLLNKAKVIGNKLEALTGMAILTDANLRSFQQETGAIITQVLNSSAGILSNFAIMFFLLYFLLVNGRQMEKTLERMIPLKDENIILLGSETVNMVRANAIGIPILAILQGIIATIGYAIFGVQEYGLWGFITGVCSMIPVVGTALIWIPLTAYFFATGNNFAGIGLLIYSLVLITNIDYVARLTLLKRFMDIHPLITIFGVIVGITLFGFWGVIFGPLLISYFIILVKIYINEFGKPIL
jgi:predicted PurR-regulated permease PerM